MEERPWEEGIGKLREKYCSNQELNLESNLREIYKNCSPWTVPRTIFFQLSQTIFIFMLSDLLKLSF